MKKLNIVLTSAILMTTILVSTTEAGYIEPGSETDPLVSKSYVDKKTEEAKSISVLNTSKIENIEKNVETIKTDIKNIKNDINDQNNSNESTTSTGEKFKVLELKKGQVIIAEESTEIIVRTGTVNAIGNKNDGISDITEGVDLKTGEQIKLNHLIIIPRSDGRGIEVKSNSTFIMIKGRYSVSN